MEQEYIIFVKRDPINSLYLISEILPYHYVSNHHEFFKFRTTQKQRDLVKTIGSDCMDLDQLKADFGDTDFLSSERSDEIKDIKEYGLGISKYIILNGVS